MRELQFFSKLGQKLPSFNLGKTKRLISGPVLFICLPHNVPLDAHFYKIFPYILIFSFEIQIINLSRGLLHF